MYAQFNVYFVSRFLHFGLTNRFSFCQEIVALFSWFFLQLCANNKTVGNIFVRNNTQKFFFSFTPKFVTKHFVNRDDLIQLGSPVALHWSYSKYDEYASYIWTEELCDSKQSENVQPILVSTHSNTLHSHIKLHCWIRFQWPSNHVSIFDEPTFLRFLFL